MPAPASPPPFSPSSQPPPQEIARRHGRTVLMLLLAVLLPLALFAALAEDIFREGGFAWDQSLLQWYAAHRTPLLTRGAEALAVIGGAIGLPVMTALIAWGLWRRGATLHATFLVLALSGAALLNFLAKLVFQRPRPDQLLAVLQEPGFSFPSGHAMANAAFGLAIGLVFWRSRAGWPLALLGVAWALLVGASRNYLGVHYPSDVLAGFLASSAWVYGLYLTLGRRWPGLRASPAGEHDTLG